MNRAAALSNLFVFLALIGFGTGCGPDAPTPAGPGAVPAAVPAEVTSASAELVISVRLAADQAPLDGVQVWVAQGDVPTPLGPSSSTFMLASATTDAEGSARLSDLPPGTTLTVTAYKDGFAPAHWTAPSGLTEGVASHELGLSPAGAVIGTVSDADLAPAPGATVFARSGATELPSVTTDEDGRFGLFGLPFDSTVILHAAGGPGERSFDTAELRLTSETPTIHRDLAFAATGRLRLLVSEPSGARIRRAWAIYGMLPERRARPARDGSLLLDDIPAGRISVRVEAEGFIRSLVVAHAHPGELRDVAVTLERGLRLSGRIVDDLGREVADAEIELDRPDGPDHDHLQASTAAAEADGEGGFSLDGLRSGAHVITAWAPGFDTVDIPITLPVPEDAKPLVVRLPRRGDVTFSMALPPSLVGPEAEAPEEVLVEIKPRGAISGTGAGEDISHTVAWSTEPIRFEDVPTGAMTLQVFVPGCGVFRQDIDLAPGSSLDLGELELVAGFSVRVRAVDSEGNVVAGVRVENLDAPSVTRSVVLTGVDGTVEFHDVSAGPNPFEVRAEGFLTSRLTVELSRKSEPFDLVLQRGGSVAVTLVDASDRPLPDRAVWVRAAGSDGPFERVSTDPQGVAELRLAVGTYELRALGAKTEVTVSERGAHEARLRASRP